MATTIYRVRDLAVDLRTKSAKGISQSDGQEGYPILSLPVWLTKKLPSIRLGLQVSPSVHLCTVVKLSVQSGGTTSMHLLPHSAEQ